MSAKRLIGVAVLTASTFAAACQTHHPPERTGPVTGEALLAAARGAQPAVIQSLQDMVGIESGSDDASGLAKMADYTAGRLRAAGAATELLPGANGKPAKLVKGVFSGDGKLRVALIAHLDTVYRPGALQTEPYRRDGDMLYGPGVADDKGGVAVILQAVEILQRQGWRDYAQLTVLFNPDEEIGSPGSGKTIAELGAANDVVLSFEPSPTAQTAGSEGVLLKAAGIANIQLTVHGRAAHAGADPQAGRNALTELAYQLLQTRDVAQGVPGAQLNWTTADAGSVLNQIPDHAEATADVRITVSGAAEKLLAAVQAKVDEHHLVADTQDELALTITRPMFDAGPKGLALAELAQAIYAELPAGAASQQGSGRKLLLIPGTTGGTDAGFAASSGRPAVLEGLGLAGGNFHRPGEYIDVNSIVPRVYLATRLLTELGAKADAGGGH